jgi:SAM-dependent methyltransferase
MTDDRQRHEAMILEQFTRQAGPFGEVSAHSEPQTLTAIAAACSVSEDDLVLDVACGPGLVSCALASAARHVTGVDLTPAMIDRAKTRQREQGLDNLSWRLADASELPFGDDTFSLVVTRYSLHHVLDPAAVVDEMVRVAKPGGRVAIIDVYTSTDRERAEAYNHVERLRDPSHVRALPLPILEALANDAGLDDVRTDVYRMEVELETQLSASFPNPGDADRIREILHSDVDIDQTTMAAHWNDGNLMISYPTAIIVGIKPDSER